MKNNADGVMERSKSVVKSNKSVVKKKINNSSFLRGILDFTISANILQFFLSRESSKRVTYHRMSH